MKALSRRDQIKRIDEALAYYRLNRLELNKDGDVVARKQVIDELLDRRNQLLNEIALEASKR